jgi:hypothetical protein
MFFSMHWIFFASILLRFLHLTSLKWLAYSSHFLLSVGLV